MKLWIDGREFEARPGQSLLEIVQELGLCTGRLSDEPLVAKIAGEVFTLNYIPMREKDGAQERESIRKAMMASDGRVGLLRYGDPSGKDVYRRTAHVCKNLTVYSIDPEKCKRCSLCAKKCPVGAISGIVGKTNFVIDPEVCVRCGLCISSCKFGAISKDQ